LDQPLRAYRQGKFLNTVPHLIGTVSEEALVFIYEGAHPSNL